MRRASPERARAARAARLGGAGRGTWVCVRRSECRTERRAAGNVRAREDEVFNQVMRAHFGAAFSYVDAMIEDATERVAAEQAVGELRLNQTLHAQLLPRVEVDTPRSNDTLVRDLVAGITHYTRLENGFWGQCRKTQPAVSVHCGLNFDICERRLGYRVM